MPQLLFRHEYLNLSGIFVSCHLAGTADTGAGVAIALPKANPKFQSVYDALADQMCRLYGICRVKIDWREYIQASGKPGRPADFLASLSMPLMGTRAILAGRSLLDDM